MNIKFFKKYPTGRSTLFLSTCCNMASIPYLLASMPILNDCVKSGAFKIRFEHDIDLILSKDFWQFRDHLNLDPFFNKLVSNAAITAKFFLKNFAVT